MNSITEGKKEVNRINCPDVQSALSMGKRTGHRTITIRIRQVHSGQNADIHSSKWRPHSGRVMAMEISSWGVVCMYVHDTIECACGQGNRFNCLSSDISISIFHNHDEVAGFAKRRTCVLGFWSMQRCITQGSGTCIEAQP